MDKINTVGELRTLLNKHPEWDKGKVVVTSDEDYGWTIESLNYIPNLNELVLYRASFLPGLD